MWKDDNDRILDIISTLSELKEIPTICPICSEKDCHIFFYRHDKKSARGGVWVWCSKCHHFAHTSAQVPKWWQNMNIVEYGMQTAVPNTLEDNKAAIDRWMSKLLSTRKDV